MDEGKKFEVEISNGGPKSFETSITLELPATWAEFNDALQKARIEDAHHCRNELLQPWNGDLAPDIIGRDVDLYELNLLAQRLAMLTDNQQLGFLGLLSMEWKPHRAALPLSRLINFTFNTDQCCVASHVINHRDLGALLLDSEMLSDEAAALLETTEPDSGFRNDLLALLGKQHMEDVGGAFTTRGYVEPSGEIKEVYVPGKMAYFDRTGAPVVLRVRKGFFDDPSYDNDLTATLDLPVITGAVDRAVAAVEAASIDECGFRCVDCLIPAAREWINDAIDAEGGIALANTFAQRLHEMKRRVDLAGQIKYKALLEASGCASLEDAIRLMDELPQYDFRPEIAQSWDYAEAMLRERYPGLPPVLFKTSQAAEAGREMLEKDHAALTAYGMIRRKDSQPLPDFRQEADGMTLRME